MKAIIENRVKNFKETIKVLKQTPKLGYDTEITINTLQSKVELLESILEEAAEETKTFKIGQKINSDNNTYIIAAVEPSTVKLINTETGRYYGISTKVTDILNISYEEFCYMVEYKVERFDLD